MIRSSRRSRAYVPVAALLLGLSSATPLAAQAAGRAFYDPPPERQVAGEAVSLAVNAIVGGVVAGARQRFRNGSFWNGFRRGAAGGAVIFAGKRLTVEPFEGAGLMGREIAAVGSSIVRNAGGGRPAFSELVFPVGPTRVYVSPRHAVPVRIQVDAVATFALVSAIADANLAFDYAASLSSGAPVFREREETPGITWEGSASAGVIRVSRDAWTSGREYRRRVLAHERVHALQYDQGFLLVGEPLESAILPMIPGGDAVGRWVDLGLDSPFWELLNHMLAYRQRPWEAEAYLLSRTREIAGKNGPKRYSPLGRDRR